MKPEDRFPTEQKEEVESNVSRYGSMSELCEDDKEIEKGGCSSKTCNEA